jgi:membrane protein YdbS with pleckstrin-like domain
MSGKLWYVRLGGRMVGPFTGEQLKERVAAGKIPNTSEIANDQEGPWHPITKLKGLPWPALVPASAPQRQPEPEFFSRAVPNSPTVAIAIQQPPPASAITRRSAQEEQVWKGCPSQWTNLRAFFWSGLFCWLVIPLFYAIWRFLDTKFTIYELTTQRLKTSFGVIAQNTEEVELHRVRDSAFLQSIFDRIVGIGTIRLNTNDTSTPTVFIRGISARVGKEIREKIRSLAEDRRDLKQVREVEYH